MRSILDCSASLTWCLPNQLSHRAESLLYKIKMSGAIVPSIWHTEMANILGLKLRDHHITEGEVRNALSLLQFLDIATDSTDPANSISHHLERVARFRVAAYDSIYLDLALRTGLPLATFDKAMVGAAQRNGIPLVTS